MRRLGGELTEVGEDPHEVLRLLHEAGSPATTASMGGRYFGGVVGGSLPVAVAAHWLAGAWDQNACLFEISPVSAYLEDIVLPWIAKLFGLPPSCGGALTTGTQWPTSPPGRGATRAVGRLRLGCRAGWALRGPTDLGRGWRGSPRDHVQGTGVARLRAGSRDHGSCGQPRPHATVGHSHPARSGDHLRAGRKRVRPVRANICRADICNVARKTARGCTLTARSGCGPPYRPDIGIWSKDWIARTHGRPTRTSGSTLPTTAGSRS